MASTLGPRPTFSPSLRQFDGAPSARRLWLIWSVVRGDAGRLLRALGHPHSPRWLRLASLALLAYVIWPLDLIPDFVPGLGVVDDIVLVPLAIRFLLERLPSGLRAEIARPRA